MDGGRCISIHALREEGDLLGRYLPWSSSDFYPRPPRGGRLCIFLIHHQYIAISIHALREEGDDFILAFKTADTQFLSTPSARRATTDSSNFYLFHLFLSTPSARRATPLLNTTACSYLFLSTPSARRATGKPLLGGDAGDVISIHALREEGDLAFHKTGRSGSAFLSTPSARRATAGAVGLDLGVIDFYPRPPRGGRPAGLLGQRRHRHISIHALREEGDHF